MLNVKELEVYINPTKDEQFSIQLADPLGHVLFPQEWVRQFFLWHEETYYGSKLNEIHLSTGPAIQLTAYELLTLLAKEKFSRFVNWKWSENDLAQACYTMAPILLETIESGNWVPDFAQIAASEEPHWTIPDSVWEEFPASFWTQPLYGPDHQETFRDLANHWFHTAVMGYLNHSTVQKDVLGKLKQLQESGLTPEQLQDYFSEERWSQWIGWSDSALPFSIGLRLNEPEDDDGEWQLETILRDRKKNDKLLVYGDKPLPTAWKMYDSEIEEEQRAWMSVIPSLRDESHAHSMKRYLSEDEAWEFLMNVSETLLNLGIEILLPSWWIAMKEANMTVKAKVKSMDTSYRPSFVGLNAMLDFDWRVSMNGAELSESQFQQMVTDQRRLVKVEGKWLKLDPEMIQRIQELMEKAKKKGLRMQDLLEQELAEDDPASEEEEDPRIFAKIQIELNRSMKKMVKQLSDVKEIPMVKPSGQFIGNLRPYQETGLSWLLFLRQFGFGACLADDMGLGKTIQLMTYLLHVKENEKLDAPFLIICPTSVLGNWQHEFAKFAPSLRVHLHYGASRMKGEEFAEAANGADVILTSYGLSHLDVEELSSIRWSAIALDEAQNIKNYHTKQSRAIRSIDGMHHIALSGTPMENRLSELWSIFDFLNKGYLGNFPHFQKKYIVPIEREDNKVAVKDLQSKIGPFLLRRTKKDPDVELNLPDKLEQKEYCALTAEQASLYETALKETFEKLQKVTGFERKGLVLQMLNSLKQLCDHPALYLKEEMPIRELDRSEKLLKLVDLVESILENGEACLVFTQYIGMGEMIQRVLREKFNIEAPFLNGSMPKNKRDEYVKSFQDGKFPIFLLSLKAGGTGLNLTTANHVIHYDRWWNPAVENQATDRAYRIGQNRFVHVHKLIASGTLEEKIDAMLDKKQLLNDEILQSNQWMTELSDEDLFSMLSLN